jgi:hypothetical protein
MSAILESLISNGDIEKRSDSRPLRKLSTNLFTSLARPYFEKHPFFKLFDFESISLLMLHGSLLYVEEG